MNDEIWMNTVHIVEILFEDLLIYLQTPWCISFKVRSQRENGKKIGDDDRRRITSKWQGEGEAW